MLQSCRLSVCRTAFDCFGILKTASIYCMPYSTKVLVNDEEVVYNEVNIQMIDRRLYGPLFGCGRKSCTAVPDHILDEFKKHGIDVYKYRKKLPTTSFSLPNLCGGNIEEHFDNISDQLTAPYVNLIQSLIGSIPEMPCSWSATTGWTSYDGNFGKPIAAPLEDVLVLDTEVLVLAGHLPTLAVAVSPKRWYSWTSPYLYSDKPATQEKLENLLIKLYPTGDTRRPKCVVGHFVSYDRARLFEEYGIKGTGTRFLDTMALHVAVSGLTSTQRHLKTAAKKQLFNNKLWQKYIEDHKSQSRASDFPSENQECMDLDWISETSLNNLSDVYRLYCDKEPPQDKEARLVFQSGTNSDVLSQFQELMTYCATDVLMTLQVFQKLFPIFQERFPHAATLFGLLEMGSMYLPVNQSWETFQERSTLAFNENELRQKKMLMQLADQALEYYSRPGTDFRCDPWLWDLDWSKPTAPKPKSVTEQRLSTLPKWYRELVPKPIKSNLDAGPALVTTQMRIAPKLLRLCWQGLPLHFDQVLKWGVLIPGRAPQPYGDPRYYATSDEFGDIKSGTSTCRHASFNGQTLRTMIPVQRMAAAGVSELHFPYGVYLSYWLRDMQRRLKHDLHTTDSQSAGKPSTQCGVNEDDFGCAYCQRICPDMRDDHLMDEFQRSIETMPLQPEERVRLAKTIAAIRATGGRTAWQQPNHSRDLGKECSSMSVYNQLGEMQVRGAAFWSDANRYRLAIPTGSKRSRASVRQAVDTVNPVIPTCWFHHLPHEAGEGMPVGSPLSRSFQSHIAAGRLHSAPSRELAREQEQEANLTNQLLLDRVHASFWQSYSKRIKSQMAVWLPPSALPSEVTCNRDYDPMHRIGAILPQVIASGTVSRRAVEPLWLTASNADRNRLGSEIKAMVQSPPGYSFVGADVDSQEMWIAALIGDASIGFQGATPYGWMTLEGNKSDGTDLHTKIARIMNITRHEAKVLNYARLYGSGFGFTKHLLAKFSNISADQAASKANELIRTTKGQRSVARKRSASTSYHTGQESVSPEILSARWTGGTESVVFNELEAIARSSEPSTPVLRAKMTRALNPQLVKEDFLPSRVNWVVQSSAVDFLHCMLTVMGWLIQKYQLSARLCISIHDEVRYLCLEDDVYRVALALQISNLLTRAFFVYRLGMRDLPESVAYFSSVEVDSCLRKNPNDDCITPSNPSGLRESYGILPGQSLTMQEIIEKTNGLLDVRIF